MKAAVLAPLYLSVSWVLIVTYQLFTQTAVSAVAVQINQYWPSVGAWIFSNVEIIIFVYSFSWIFVLSSVIPSVILGKQRSVLVQFLVVLVLTLLAFILQGILLPTGELPEELLGFAFFLNNPLVATVFLLIPYILMLILDLHTRRKEKTKREMKKITSILHEL